MAIAQMELDGRRAFVLGPTVGALSAIGVAVLFGLFLHINYIAPIAGDMWLHVDRGAEMSPFAFWWRGFMNANPRIGQVLLGHIGVSKGHLMFLQALSLGSLLVVASVSAMQPVQASRTVWTWCFAAFGFFSLLSLSTNYLGQLFFYPPRTANYAFGYALLLAFLLPYLQAACRGNADRPWPLAVLMFPLGVLAGMSNEHTVPAHIALLGLCILVFAFRRRPHRTHAWMYVGLVSLIVGYALLFFAPGQTKRYDGTKFAAFDDGLFGLIGRCFEALARFFADSWPLWLATGILLGLLFVLHGRDAVTRSRPLFSSAETLFLGYALLTTLGMAATTGASPLPKPSLYFAPAVNVAIAGAFAAVRLAEFKIGNLKPLGLVLVVLAIAVNVRFWSMALYVYQTFEQQSDERQVILADSKAKGILDIVWPRLEVPNKYRNFYRVEGLTDDPGYGKNRRAAALYGVNTIVVPPR